MPVSPLCQVKDGVAPYAGTLNGVNVTPSNTISIRLANTADVTTWYLQVLGTDELSTPPVLSGVDPSTNIVATPSSVVTFTAPSSTGHAFLFQSMVTGVGGPQSTTFVLYLVTPLGKRVGAAGETREGDITFGWAAHVNPLIRNPGGLLPPGTGTSDTLVWDGGAYAPRQLTEDDILPGFNITSFNGGDIVELGRPVKIPSFTATYTTAPTSAVLTDSEGTPPKDVSSTPTAFSTDVSYLRMSYGDVVTLTLTASKGSVVRTATTSFQWTQRVYWGKSSYTGPYGSGFITGLDHSNLATSIATTLNMTGGDTPGVGEKIYYAFRIDYGTPTFYIGGFEGGFEQVASSVSVTNVYGVIEKFDVWRSVQANLGPTIVTVT